MQLTKKIARTVLFPAIFNTGLEKIWKWCADHSILNIMYHGVVVQDSNYFSPRHITAELFEKHIEYISKNFEIISVSEAFDMVKNNIKPKRKAVTISFDDGYKNNLDIALPILEKYNIKTTFFISSVCVENSEFPILWADVIACLNFFHKEETIGIEDLEFKNLIEKSSGIHIMDFLKKQSPEKRDDIIDKLFVKFELREKLKTVPKEIWALMSKEELQKFSSSKIVDIGSHGHLHYNLANIKIADSVKDMEKSKFLIEGAIGKKIDMIAYPDGNYNDAVKTKAYELGFKKQLAVDYLFEADKSDYRILNRHGVSGTTTFESSMFFLNKAFYSKGFN